MVKRHAHEGYPSQNDIHNLNDTWDRVLKEARLGDPSRFFDHIRPHDHSPRCITIPHPFFLELKAGAYYITNSHSAGPGVFLREQSGGGIKP